MTPEQSATIDKVFRRALLDPPSAEAAMTILARKLTGAGVDLHDVRVLTLKGYERAPLMFVIKGLDEQLAERAESLAAAMGRIEKLEAFNARLKLQISNLKNHLQQKDIEMDNQFTIKLTRLVPDFDMEARNGDYGRFKDRQKLFAHVYSEFMRGVSPGDIGREVGLARHRIVAILRKMEREEAKAEPTVAPNAKPTNVLDFDALRTAATQKFDRMRDEALAKIADLEGALA